MLKTINEWVAHLKGQSILAVNSEYVNYLLRYYRKLDDKDKCPLTLNPNIIKSQLTLLEQVGLEPNLKGAMFIAIGLYLNLNKLTPGFNRELSITFLILKLYELRHQLTYKTKGALIIELSKSEGLLLSHLESELVTASYSKLIS